MYSILHRHGYSSWIAFSTVCVVILEVIHMLLDEVWGWDYHHTLPLCGAELAATPLSSFIGARKEALTAVLLVTASCAFCCRAIHIYTLYVNIVYIKKKAEPIVVNEQHRVANHPSMVNWNWNQITSESESITWYVTSLTIQLHCGFQPCSSSNVSNTWVVSSLQF